jgi:hypothetical protein
MIWTVVMQMGIIAYRTSQQEYGTLLDNMLSRVVRWRTKNKNAT